MTIEETGQSRSAARTAPIASTTSAPAVSTSGSRWNRSRRTASRCGSVEAGVAVDISLEPDLHYAEAVSVGVSRATRSSPTSRPRCCRARNSSLKTEASLGELLKTEPGVAQRSLGPAPSRPVIRGLDGDRVLVLQNSQRTGDLSSQSGDHGVTINPAAATQVEVVRGPATLLYGANAIGGLVNVVNQIIPTTPSTRPPATAQIELGPAAAEAGGVG